LPGGQAQTIWPALFSRFTSTQRQPVVWVRERWDTPDGDFIDVDRIGPNRQPSDGAIGSHRQEGAGPLAVAQDLASQPAKEVPLLVLFHGLEGSSQSHYAQAIAHACELADWSIAVAHFRGCSGELNRAPRAYHSGDWQEVDWVLRRFRAQHTGPICAVGISLGGNALLRWAEEMGAQAATVVQTMASVSAPLDLAEGGAAISRGFNRRVYTPMFLRTLKPKALAMVRMHPGLADAHAIAAARDLHDFDDAFTAPVHGFRDADDYWRRASSKPQLNSIRLPTLVINARNDPFLPARVLPAPSEMSPGVWLEQPEQGGHVGFARGQVPGQLEWMPQRLLHFFKHQGGVTC
jgi:predicted alpha/beta-fold hydrolase